MTDLLAAAREWIDAVHPHALHLERTLHWVQELEPRASTALRIAAVTHDAERAYPDRSAQWQSWRDFDSEAYNRWHQDRCAEIVGSWLRENGDDEALARDASALVAVHEDGGWAEADLLQAADSLSFLEVMVPVVVAWVTEAGAPVERAELKLHVSRDRIAPDLHRARDLATDLLGPALERLADETDSTKETRP